MKRNFYTLKYSYLKWYFYNHINKITRLSQWFIYLLQYIYTGPIFQAIFQYLPFP